MSVLFAIVQTGDDQPDWYLADAVEDSLQQVRFDDLAAQKADRVVLVVSGEDVFVTQVESAVRSLDDFRTAALFQLEDELSQNISQLHIAVSERGKENAAMRTVAVASHPLMLEWLSDRGELSEDQLDRLEIIPDVTLFDGDVYPFIFDGDRHVFVSNGLKTISVAPVLATDLVPALLQQLDMRDVSYITSSDPVLPVADQLLAGVNLAEQHSKPLTVLLADRLLTGRGLDLRQGNYARKSRMSFNGMAWMGTGALAASVFLAWSVMTGVSAWQLSHQTDALYESTVTAYAEAFPAEGRVLDPRGKTVSRLRAAPTGAGSRAFVNLASAFYLGLEDVEGVELDGFSFNGSTNELTATLRFSSYQERDALKRSFEDKGLSLALGGARQENGLIIGEAVLGGLS